MTDIVNSAAVQSLLDRASGLGESGGNPRLKAITRDLLQAIMTIVEKHDISESEFWQATKFLQDGAGEFGLIEARLTGSPSGPRTKPVMLSVSVSSTRRAARAPGGSVLGVHVQVEEMLKPDGRCEPSRARLTSRLPPQLHKTLLLTGLAPRTMVLAD